MTMKQFCTGCDGTLTWASARVSYGRMLEHGLTVEEAKARSPRCARCTTTDLREQNTDAATVDRE